MPQVYDELRRLAANYLRQLGAALAFLVIEPATARAAFRTKSEIRNLRSEI